MIVAIDGPAASGKGTLAKRIAAALDYRHLDTGLLYRAVAHAVLSAGGDPGDVRARLAAAEGLDLAHLSDESLLRAPSMGEAASVVAADPRVREAILAFQRDFAAVPPGAVLDGRDIATVVCPAAEVKIYVTATPEIRAERRFRELRAAGVDIDFETVLADIRQRDERDMSRPVAPLRRAEDAHLLDTTELDIETAVRTALGLVRGA